MGKKSETFVKETAILEQAKSVVGPGAGVGTFNYQDAFATLVENYEELLSEARFLTRVSDRLEKKLSRANEALEANNIKLEATNTRIAKENTKVKKKNKQIAQEYNKLGRRMNKFQVAVAVIIFLVFLLVLFGLYILFGDGLPK